MKFGKIENIEKVDFSLPSDHPGNIRHLKFKGQSQLHFGCARWGKSDLTNFYPRGTMNELEYYATQFNSIELNPTFYRIFPSDQIDKWANSVGDNFTFYPKIPQQISHYRQLKNVSEVVDRFLLSITHLNNHLGPCFLQLNERFSPKHIDKLKQFIIEWPKDLQLAIEVRHPDWFSDKNILEELGDFLEVHGVIFTLVDTPGRRDLLHMRLTSDSAFIRWVATNQKVDAVRIEEWANKIAYWNNQGIREIGFFVHQPLSNQSPFLIAELIEKVNTRLGTKLKIPKRL